MLEHGIGSVIVVNDDDRLEGILTATDFVGVIAEGAPDPNATVGTAMSTDLTTTTANEPIRSVADLMLERGFHHVPVLDDREVIGVITTTDLTEYVSRGEELRPRDTTANNRAPESPHVLQSSRTDGHPFFH